MTPADFAALRTAIDARNSHFEALTSAMSPAADDVESTDLIADGYAEAVFLRMFTAYERDLEALFLHYAVGGLTHTGAAAHSYLNVLDEHHARRLTKAGFKFLSWAKPRDTRQTADHYLRDGWPISRALNSKSDILTDCERVRNRIAHDSIEAVAEFNIVQRNVLTTERLFPISAGQFLRIRVRRLKSLVITHYLETMKETLDAILDPPP